MTHVLIVEDERLIARLIEMSLTARGTTAPWRGTAAQRRI